MSISPVEQSESVASVSADESPSEKSLPRRSRFRRVVGWFPWRAIGWILFVHLILVTVVAWRAAGQFSKDADDCWIPFVWFDLPLTQMVDSLTRTTGIRGVGIVPEAPLTDLFMDEVYYWSLYIEYFLLKNSQLVYFAINAVFLPLVFLVFGTINWGVVWILIRTVFRFGRRIDFDKRPSETVKTTEEKKDNHTKEVGGPPTKSRIRFRGAVTFCLLLTVGWWSFFLTTNIRRCVVWNKDFQTVRILVSRFYAEFGRLPKNWDEIVEAEYPLVTPEGRHPIPPGEHYPKNPGLSDRIELNFDHFRRIDTENASPHADWVFRIRERSELNPTGLPNEPCFQLGLWNRGLSNAIVFNMAFRRMGSDSPKRGAPRSPEEAGLPEFNFPPIDEEGPPLFKTDPVQSPNP